MKSIKDKLEELNTTRYDTVVLIVAVIVVAQIIGICFGGK